MNILGHAGRLLLYVTQAQIERFFQPVSSSSDLPFYKMPTDLFLFLVNPIFFYRI